MSRYIDADKLIAEIERRMDDNCGLGEKAECFNHRAVEDNDILAIIDSLQQEQPEDTEKKQKTIVQWPELSNCKHDCKTCFAKCFYRKEQNENQQPEVDLHELGKTARKSIWHNVAEETPTKIGSEVIVACRNKNKEDGIWLYDLIQCWEGEWKPRENWETPVKWAYVRDLDNARKEK